MAVFVAGLIKDKSFANSLLSRLLLVAMLLILLTLSWEREFDALLIDVVHQINKLS